MQAPAQAYAAETGTLAIRPEHMTVSAEARPDANGVPASVTATTYLGPAMRLGLATRSGVPLTVTLPVEVAASALSQGRDLWVSWPADKGTLLPAEA